MGFDSTDIYSISVVVIGYNIEKYIDRCLKSIFNQSYENYEVIFVNDGSTDSTLMIANSFLNKGLEYKIINKENGGIISARKKGVQAAKGNYVLFVDGDDSVRPNLLYGFVEYISNNDPYDIIVSDYYEENQNKKWIYKKNPFPYGEMISDTFAKGVLDGSFYHFMFAKLYRRDFLNEKKYFRFPNITIAEDLLTNAVLGVYLPRVIYIKHAGYNYHYNDSSVTRDGRLDIVDRQLYTLKILKHKIQKICGNRYDEYINYQWYLFAFGYIQTRYSYEFKEYLIKKCIPYLSRIHKNKMYRSQKLSLGLVYGRILIFLYTRVPYLARSLDGLSKRTIDFLRINK